MDAKSNKPLHVTEKCSVDDDDQQFTSGSFWGFIRFRRKTHYHGLNWSVLKSLDSSCTLEPNNSVEALNSGKEGQHWPLFQDQLDP